MTKKIFPILIIIFLAFISYGVFSEITKSVKNKRLECQTKTTTFEKIFYDSDIKEAITAFENKNYEINSYIEYSKYMKSNLIDILTNKQSDEILKNIINKYTSTNSKQENLNEKLFIHYYIYENDKEDSGKKNNEAKSYAGYLVFEFKYNKKLVYKIQIDYMKLDANDLENRMDCAIQSFLSILK
ncbi:hypothetical protein Abu_1148 [Aliarcobacter butzleri RM4018]|uniref:Uncharacterized protein n=1 Tax=Aliarcobacter butzleri (strain RM4018) TaxID=367737 RepID=A8ETY4_ALIB4|nr:hypothetical protein [Aliarcobacter butzleri]ABV67408.1 hypothetical protein Abu_1148 [Aliarcobacter butzleri RM4018]MCG3662147.1 hypothetical protein [Aliarcobacter butzleri]MCR8709548.1 hypothetical protein [Aliarcobacter butzleri]MCT7589388.1 hypothetical protein [Aliarcobacter butzleri]MDN5041905.1 hypothetical protein [Aliarcobacter butzleri]